MPASRRGPCIGCGAPERWSNTALCVKCHEERRKREAAEPNRQHLTLLHQAYGGRGYPQVLAPKL